MKPSRHEKPNREKSRNDRPFRGVAIPFFCLLALVSVLAWCLPLRPDYSESEKRSLAAFPVPGIASVLDGSWARDFELWFSDTFPGREGWISAGDVLEELHGFGSVTVHGSISADEIPEVSPSPETGSAAAPAPQPTPAPAATPAPQPTPSAAPRPEATAEPTPEPTASLEEGLEVDWGQFSSFGAVAVIGDSAYELYGFYEYGSRQYGKLMAKAAEILDGQARVFSIIAPNSTGIVLSAEDYSRLGCSDQAAGIAYSCSHMGSAVSVQIYETLRAHNGEYLYFRTDHHWTALGAWYAYEQWAKAAGFEPVTLDKYTAMDMGDYLGSFYRGYGKGSAMKSNPDRLYAWVPPGDITMYINGRVEGYEWPLVSDMSRSDPEYKYGAFLYGDRALTEIVNESIDNDSACLLVKDSFGNPFAVYLTQHYRTVYVIDYRFTFNLSSFVSSHGVDDVIFLNALTLSQADTAINNFTKSFK